MYNLSRLIHLLRKEIPTFARYFGVFSVIFTLPQIFKIFFTHSHLAAGVSALAFSAYATIDALWVFYGIKYKDNPIIVANFLGVIANALVAGGVLMYGGWTY